MKTEMIVGWLEVELMRVLRFFAVGVCEEGAWVVIDRNHVDCEAMCDSCS